LIERFDRTIEEGEHAKVHYASWSGLAHAHRDTTGAYSYSQLIMLAKQLKLGQSALTEIFKRTVFNIVGRNQDDHTKNFGFLMRKSGEWRLAPAFDMTYSYNPVGLWTRVHQISLNGKQDDFNRTDLLAFAQLCNLDKRKATPIIERTLTAFAGFEKLANEYDIDASLTKTICNSLRLNIPAL
jgi:serine/threonine-protein kinase HipA